MSVPKKRRTHSSGKRRASHFGIKSQSSHKCANCGHDILPHRACPKCGYYKGEKKVK